MPTSKSESKLKPISLGIFAVALWAAIPAFVKVGSTLETLPFLLLLRFLIASLFFVALVPRIFSKLRQLPAHLYLALTICLGANFFFQGMAMLYLPVSWYLIIFCLNPLFALLFLGVPFSRKLILGIGLSIGGTLLFVNLNEVQTAYGWLPLVYVAIGMMTWVAYTLLVKRFQIVYTNIEVTALTQFSALIACALIWAATGFGVFQLSTQHTASVLALGALTPLAYFGFTSCLRALPKFGVVSQYLEPVFGIAIGVFFFSESLSAAQLLGSAMIVFGSVTIEN